MAANEIGRWYNLPDNYLYISHLGKKGEWIRLPNSPESLNDSMTSTFGRQNALARTAPILTYSESGPRTLQVNLRLHRDMMDSVNSNGASNMSTEDYDDYTDTLIKKLQAIALPKYNLTNKFVEPPLVALRLTNEIFIKGVVNGSVGVTYEKPILSNGKYALVSVQFNITETDPYDASTVAKNGGFRGITRCMRAEIDNLKNSGEVFYDIDSGNSYSVSDN